ncbi:Glycosyl hydrolase family 3 N terminal domain containing protein [Trichomonas vaginalis G3]|uniref:Glycosyl hydrolase family 3 N terminal domain containing protein n=1 Tax=Trichomonas vaginalis (strain ATCC PRA-98 / G3) TaxID=412133 RepID=A2E8H3_TRIV3|nr:glycosyl hydrolase [Trichomonas vaginalis G3]EAY11010.1 Glycosyl hydrolase family 3 N terminal domain containing protein [Trichomonas vaginalis G3]KAI5531816.1 beta-hexosaminidase-related family [Trichomonas vaginalis G3]|eukprot:XP_001323233.1 glycosyl hydrolase [Trichomonas vaginalis G3]
MGRNLRNQEQIRNLTATIQNYSYNQYNLPSLISIDQESGSNIRMFRNSTVFPSSMTIAATNNLENAYKSSYLQALELNDVGINLNFAPVSDVNSNIHNPIVGDRSFGDNPNVVSKYVQNYIKGHKKAGVLCCSKHFPGHGETSQDSHYELPRINRTFESLKEIDLPPFKASINYGVDMIMLGHLITPLDETMPCSTSSKCINYLRNELGYEGVTITDSMVMKAIKQEKYNETILEAILAGADLICSCGKVFEPFQYYTIDYLMECVEKGLLPMKRVEESLKRIIKLKLSLEKVDHAVDYQHNYEIARNISENGITYFNDENQKLIPLNNSQSYICIESNLSKEYMLEEYIKESFCTRLSKIINLKKYVFDKKVSQNDKDQINILAKENKTTIFVPYKSRWNKEQIQVIKEYYNVNNNVILVSLSDPYEFLDFKFIHSKIIGYEYSPLSLSASVNVIIGANKINASIPFNVPNNL